jgi:hypothetical protein
MKVGQKNIDLICRKFAEMQTKEDLLALLNEAKKILFEGDAKYKPIHLNQLTYYANPQLSQKRYTQFVVKKKSGKERTINAPVRGLKSILRVLNFVLQCIYEPHKAAMGFVWEKSIVDNARLHVGQRYIYSIDLKDFFHSFDRNRVKMGFFCEPFNLKAEREPLAFLLACLCTHPFEVGGEIKTVLPQGSPTSPTITNILCHTLDRRLSGLAKRFSLKYSRYADDITFSAYYAFSKNEDFLLELERLITEDQKLGINPDKTRLQHAFIRQEVTGLVVNEKPNVRVKYVKQIRMWLYYWEKYGQAKAQEIFFRDYMKERSHKINGEPLIENVISGKLDFLKMVKGDRDSTYLKLAGRLENLLGNDQTSIPKIENVGDSEANTPQRKPTFKSEPKPKDVAIFMSLFNQREGLKYLTHDFDEDGKFDVGEFWINSYKVFKENANKLFIPQSLWRIIKQFAFSDKKPPKWNSISENYDDKKELALGWTSLEWQEWSKDNNLHPIRNEKYKEVINDFRRITRIESPNLERLVDKCLETIFKNEKGNFVITKKDLSKADFYTHVVRFKVALETVFEEIKKRTDTKEKRKISITYERETENDYFVRKVLITHYNSFPSKELDVLLQEWQSTKGSMGRIRGKLEGYCYWSVETVIDDKPIRINILKDKETLEYEPIEKAEGFTHILTFYYK